MMTLSDMGGRGVHQVLMSARKKNPEKSADITCEQPLGEKIKLHEMKNEKKTMWVFL